MKHMTKPIASLSEIRLPRFNRSRTADDRMSGMLEQQRREAKSTVNKYVALAGGTVIATGPIPGSSTALTGIEAKMVYDIGRNYGFHLSVGEAAAVVGGLLAASATLKTAATEASTFVPVLGWWVAKPSIAIAVCKAVGEAAIRYFEDAPQHKIVEEKNK
jgi:uncharacterized protein (DUF697 family)